MGIASRGLASKTFAIGVLTLVCACHKPVHTQLDPTTHLVFLQRDEPPADSGDFLTDLRSSAWLRNPEMGKSESEVAQARAAIQTAGTRPNPSLQLGFTRASGVPSPWTLSLSPTFLFETAGKRNLRIHLAEIQEKSAELKLAGTAWNLRMSVHRAWMEWQKARALLALSEEETPLRKDLLALQQRRFDLGQVGSVDLNTSALELRQFENRLASTQLDLRNAELKLAQAAGRSPDALTKRLAQAQAPLLKDPPQPNYPNDEALIHRLDVRQVLLDWESNETRLDDEWAHKYPNVQWSPGYAWDQGVRKWSLGLSLELPVFDHRQGPIAEILAKRKSLAADLRLKESQAINDVAKAKARWQQAESRRLALRQAQELSASKLQLATRSFELGMSDRSVLLSQRVEALAIRLQAWEAWGEAQSARLDAEDAFQRSFDIAENPFAMPEGKP